MTYIKPHNLILTMILTYYNNNTATLNLSYNWPLSPLLLPISYYFCQNRKWPNLVYIDIDIQIYFKKIYLPILDRHFQLPKPYFLIYLGNIIQVCLIFLPNKQIVWIYCWEWCCQGTGTVKIEQVKDKCQKNSWKRSSGRGDLSYEIRPGLVIWKQIQMALI